MPWWIGVGLLFIGVLLPQAAHADVTITAPLEYAGTKLIKGVVPRFQWWGIQYIPFAAFELAIVRKQDMDHVCEVFEKEQPENIKPEIMKKFQDKLVLLEHDSYICPNLASYDKMFKSMLLWCKYFNATLVSVFNRMDYSKLPGFDTTLHDGSKFENYYTEYGEDLRTKCGHFEGTVGAPISSIENIFMLDGHISLNFTSHVNEWGKLYEGINIVFRFVASLAFIMVAGLAIFVLAKRVKGEGHSCPRFLLILALTCSSCMILAVAFFMDGQSTYGAFSVGGRIQFQTLLIGIGVASDILVLLEWNRNLMENHLISQGRFLDRKEFRWFLGGCCCFAVISDFVSVVLPRPAGNPLRRRWDEIILVILAIVLYCTTRSLRRFWAFLSLSLTTSFSLKEDLSVQDLRTPSVGYLRSKQLSSWVSLSLVASVGAFLVSIAADSNIYLVAPAINFFILLLLSIARFVSALSHCFFCLPFTPASVKVFIEDQEQASEKRKKAKAEKAKWTASANMD